MTPTTTPAGTSRRPPQSVVRNVAAGGTQHAMITEQPMTEVDGDCLVVPDGASLPPVCIRCGEPAVERPRTYAFTWNPHGYRMGRGKVGSIAAVATNRRGRTLVYYCGRHRPRVLRTCVVMGFVASSLLAVTVYEQRVGRPSDVGFVTMMLGIAVIMATLVYLAIPPLLIKCRKIEDGRLWLHVRVPRATQRMVAALKPGSSTPGRTTVDT